MRALERRRVSRGVSRARHDVDVTVAGARSRVHDRVSVGDDTLSPIDQHLDHGVDPFEGSATEDHLRHVRRLRAESHARSTANLRRRQVQQVLIGLSVIGLVLLVMGVVPLLLGLLPAAALAVFFYASHRQSQKASAGQAREDRREASRAGSSRDRRSTQRSRSSQRSRSGERTRSDEDVRADEETDAVRRSTSARRSSSGRRSSASRRARTPGRHVEAPAARTDSTEYSDLEGADVRMLSTTEVEGRRAKVASEGRWAPVEAPLPGYLDSARATRMPRNLDSTANGDWTSERMLEQAEALRTPGADVESELGLDEYVDIPGSDSAAAAHFGHRRAVND